MTTSTYSGLSSNVQISNTLQDTLEQQFRESSMCSDKGKPKVNPKASTPEKQVFYTLADYINLHIRLKITVKGESSPTINGTQISKSRDYGGYGANGAYMGRMKAVVVDYNNTRVQKTTAKYEYDEANRCYNDNKPKDHFFLYQSALMLEEAS